MSTNDTSMAPENNSIEEAREKAKQFHKKGEIKRRIIQGDQDLAYVMAEIAQAFETLYQREQQAVRDAGKMKEALVLVTQCVAFGDPADSIAREALSQISTHYSQS